MREILFRGKRKDTEKWVQGHLHKMDGYGTGYTEYGIQVQDISTSRPWSVLVLPETVGQYTGSTDKNGKKLFEGDIGRYKQTDGAKENGKPIICTGVVLYNEKTASFAVKSKDEQGRKYFDYFPIKDFEVIGNIHDNPEIMEEKV